MKETIEGWLCRGKQDNKLYLHQTEPVWDEVINDWNTVYTDGYFWDEMMEIPDVFKTLTNKKPVKCNITIETL